MNPRQVRGFHYAIEPAYRRELWNRDAGQQALARVQREANAARDRLRELQATLHAHAQRLASDWSARMDPRQRAGALSHLVQARHRVSDASDELRRIEARLADALRDCRRSEMRVELTARHRDDCLNAHLLGETRRVGRQADEQWITRARWMALQGEAE